MFYNLLQNNWAKINQTWYKLSLGKGNSMYSNKRPGLRQRGDNYKNIKMGRGHLKISFFKTTELEKLKFA
jgi:hypothetical protein